MEEGLVDSEFENDEKMTEKKASGISNPAFEKDEVGDAPAKQNGVATVSKYSNLPEAEKKILKFKILKNIVIISIAFVFLFTSYNSMANLQSSINDVDGTASLSTLYAALVISCCFVPSWLIKKLKTKYTIALCMLGYSTYIAAQFYPEIYTLVPTAIILGLGAAPMWSAKCTYLTKVGAIYGDLVGEESEVIITRFFGIFFLFFQSTQVWGNLISSSVLSVGVGETNRTEEDLAVCGINFCPWDQLNASSSGDEGGAEEDEIPKWQIYTMATIYLCFSLFASVIIMLFVDPLKSFGEDEENDANSGKTGVQLLVASFNHMRHPYQLLIIPLTIWSGVEQAFIGADYTAAYVSCGLGVHMVGYVMICFGVCDAICSVSFSPLVKIFGRIPVFTMGFVINLGIIITLIHWMPRPDDLPIFFVISGLWGVSDAVWQTQINALYGVIFPGESEAAFSNYRLWESLGFIIAYACSTLICIEAKITILLVFISLGAVGYYVIEAIEWRGGLRKDSEGKVIPIDKLFVE